MHKPLYLMVGRSASGKTTIANLLESRHELVQLQSYTTRPKRSEDEVGHTFISNEDFDRLKNIVAYTEYHGHRYCSTQEQIDAVDTYVIDVPGVETLLKSYKSDRPIIVVYFDATIRTRIDRMVDRGESDAFIVSRLYNDDEFDWKKELNKLAWHYKKQRGKNVEMYIIDANQDIESVLTQVISCTNYETEDD